MKRRIIWSLVFGALLFVEQATAQEHGVYLGFNHLVGNDTLQLDEKTYHNSMGEPFTVNRFKYYISNIVVKDSSGKKSHPYPGVHLIDEAWQPSKKITLGYAPAFAMGSIEFVIGVDSMYNVSGVQTDALDPLKGMFWTWNNGYVFAKLEGTSDSSNTPLSQFTYDVGGYKKSQLAARKVVLPCPPNNGWNIIINVDILKWFDGMSKISIRKTPLCHEPGKFAMQLADNYSKMFSIVETK